ncbi:MAG: CRISPR-associated endonuclease Cas2 [candidate division WOR-3 bacterium]
MRRSCLVCYDICDPKRWRKVFRIMKGYGEHWQYSVFFCTLKEIDLVRMQSALEEVMNLKEDQALIIDLGSDETAAREAAAVIGRPLTEIDERIIII